MGDWTCALIVGVTKSNSMSSFLWLDFSKHLKSILDSLSKSNPQAKILPF